MQPIFSLVSICCTSQTNPSKQAAQAINGYVGRTVKKARFRTAIMVVLSLLAIFFVHGLQKSGHYNLRVTDIQSRRRLRSSSLSTLRPCVSGRRRPGLERPTRLRHVSVNLRIIPYCVEDVSVFPDLLILTTRVTLTL